ncbi:MAG: PD40 domain-containing protein [Flavobacteriales bacterium]|nr:PD40 domain-containing protein [Flavobacteriales bacterium]MCC6938668.1 PD40 domain-containing protein [Flavobacteriales bacterium]
MMSHNYLFLGLLAFGCSTPDPVIQIPEPEITGWDSTLIHAGEKHFSRLKRLTFGGDNAEAYWSFSGKQLIFQSTNPSWGESCDQIHIFSPFTDDLQTKQPSLISIQGGRTTCSYFLPGDSLVLFASTYEHGASCPAVPERRSDGKYVWPIYASFDIQVADLKGNIRRKLTDTEGYDAEATVSPKGDRIVFTSMRDGDLDLYTMNIDGSDVKRVTNTLGYDGGAFFSPDGTKLLWRASRPTTPEEIEEYSTLLKEGLVKPTSMELYIANADGSDARKITNLGQANWAPYWHPSGNKVIFASNHTTERGFPFTMYMINTDGTGLEQVSYGDTFDAFPVFSADGRYLVFSSNRFNGGTHETNLFLAEWAD